MASGRRELRLPTGLVLLVYADLSSPIMPKIVTTDASTKGQGVMVSSQVASSALQELAAPKQNRDLHQTDNVVKDEVGRQRWFTLVSSRWPAH
jgi:hypothetical protein